MNAANLLDALDELDLFVSRRWQATRAEEWTYLQRWVELARTQMTKHIAAGDAVSPCSECGRWNYHLRSCSAAH